MTGWRRRRPPVAAASGGAADRRRGSCTAPSRGAAGYGRRVTASDANVVALADGSVAAIRPIAVGDGPVIAATFEALSPESRYRRFLQPMSQLNERTLSFLLDVDHHDREALVAEDVATGKPLAVARFRRSRDDPAAAELAVAVVDTRRATGWAARSRIDWSTARAKRASRALRRSSSWTIRPAWR